MERYDVKTCLRVLVIAGNILFVLWILFNGMDAGWQGTRIQIASYVSLVSLLILNSYFLTRKRG